MRTLFLLVSLIFLGSEGSVVSQGKAPWTHQFQLDSPKIKVEWRSLTENGSSNPWLEMQISGETKGGYIGFGFSENGGMNGADLAIGWIDEKGQVFMKDFHGVGNNPVLDKEQNYEALSGKLENGITTIKFRRQWFTCDKDDIEIRNDTMRIMWALGSSVPSITADNNVTGLTWHGLNTRGVQSVFIHDTAFADPFPDEVPEKFPGVKQWDLVMNNTIDKEQTTYFCKIVKFPFLEKKHHMIGWKPILTPENRPNVHHITFYECMVPPEHGGTENLFEKHTMHTGGRCYTKNMPPEWTKHCVTFLFVWVAGGEGEMFPQHVGSPLGEPHGGATYFMMEVHYDNPTRKVFHDKSGVRIFYTDKLRENDGSVMLMGYRITPFLLLPPKQPNFVMHGICSSECTEQALPPTGIKVINTLLHGHLSMRKLRLRHFRGGKELPLIAKDDYYDFNYQQSRTLQEEITVLPGDELITECEYETTQNNRMVLGGLSTTQEMCQTFFIYYPRINLMQCTSQYEFTEFFKPLGIREVNGTVLKQIKMPYNPSGEFDPPDDAKELEESGEGDDFHSLYDHINIVDTGKSVAQQIKEMNWTDTTIAKKIEKQWQHGRHYAYCTGHGRKRYPLKKYIMDYPTISKPAEKEDPFCKAKQSLE
ncbi:DBH-like monooxygenase protein 1 [Folsomia candida]|nr:DBH-like monooxygenase protein 1 [Folsomia candida]